jgi:uncharacterized protein (DUF1499 family)
MKMILVIIIFVVAVIGWGVYSNTYPAVIGLKNEHLAACPNSPNCVNSEATDNRHAIKAFPASEGLESFKRLTAIIETIPNAKILTNTQDYLHAEFTSKMMGFVDDVEFHFVPDESVIHVRSASRIGYGDMGMNRKRIEDIRILYDKNFQD